MAFLRAGDDGEPGRSPGREPFFKAPAVVFALIAALVAAHLARIWLPPEASERIINEYGFIPLRYAADALEPGGVMDRAIPFASYMFLHADAMHLTINCLWLLAFGPVVARRFGTWLFLVFFTICGVAAAASFLALAWRQPGVIIGASGAISGLMAAGIRMVRTQPQAADPGLVPILSAQVLVFSGLWVAINLVAGLSGFDFMGGVRPIAWQAHLGGYFVGLFLAGPFDRLGRKSDTDLPIGA